MDENYEMLGSKIRRYRERKGLSQEELAEMIDATERHLRNVEYGQKGLSVSLLISLANALDITADDLLSDYLTKSKMTPTTEFIDIIDDCSDTKRAILIGMLKNLNELLSEYGI